MKKVLITGIDGFTGIYLEELLLKAGYDVYGLVYPTSRNEKHLSCNIVDKDDVIAALNAIKPDYIIHLAGISFVKHSDVRQIYDINFFGTLNILKALLEIGLKPDKIVLASSANVYGNPPTDIIDETICPVPVNHYAISKLAMEFKARTYFDRLNILITRPFNYTGIGQGGQFLIPKIVSHFKEGKQEIELGNLDVVRDFSDVRFVASVYKELMECNTSLEIVNICSGRGDSLKDILQKMSSIAKHELRTKINPDFVRKNEVKTLIGSNKKLVSFIGELKPYPIEETLKWMFYAP
ncbi:MAG: GDP-mannose 4,6-dehydratase [Nitrospirae bacterium]|nr:GDP-mannose 4,6-dehydratase [Nitrospirota bacterium]